MRYQVQKIVFDAESGVCWQVHNGQADKGEEIQLKSLNFLLMQALVSHYPGALSVQKIAQMVWGRNFVEDDTVAKRVSILRSELAKLVGEKDLIRTLPNREYQLIGPVQEISRVEKPDKFFAVDQDNTLQAAAPKSKIWIIVASLAIVLATLGYLYLKPERTVLRDPETGLELVAPN